MPIKQIHFHVPRFLCLFPVVLSAAIMLCACTADTVSPGDEIQTDTSTEQQQPENFRLSDDWQTLAPGLAIRDMIITTDEDTGARKLHFTALKVDPELLHLEVMQDTLTPRTVTAWRDDLGALAVINGGYFTEENLTAGFLIAQGVRSGTANKNGYAGTFYLKANGTAGIRSTLLEPYTPDEDLAGAIQSYPLLVLDSIPQVLQDSGKLARRTIVATDIDGNMLLMVGRDFSTLYEVSQALALEAGILTALNLDGGSSSGMSVLVDAAAYRIPSAQVPNVIAVFPAN